MPDPTVGQFETSVGFWRRHNGGIHQRWSARCADCDFRLDSEDWQHCADALNRHRRETREWVSVAQAEQPGWVYVVQGESYDDRMVHGLYGSLYAALLAHPHSWLQDGLSTEGSLYREDGDAIRQTALSITRTKIEN